MNSTSISLLERLRQPGEQDAWERFVELYTPLIFSWARRVGMRDADAADLVQDVFVTLVQTLPTFAYDRHQSFRCWLRTVTMNKWRDRRKKKGEKPLSGDDGQIAELPGANDLEAFWEAEYRQHVTKRALQVLQSDFQPATWKAFWEHVVVGRPAPEVAKEMGLTAGAVYAAKFRILDRLRIELAGMLE